MAKYATGKKAWGFSDRSGFRYRLREMKTEWNGLKVGPDVSSFDGFTSTILEKAAGYSITKVNDDTYTFSASSGTATTGEVRGGGGRVTAGPVTLGT